VKANLAGLPPRARTQQEEEAVAANLERARLEDLAVQRARLQTLNGCPLLHWGRTPDWEGEWGRKTRKLIAAYERNPSLMAALISTKNGGGKTQSSVELIKAYPMKGALYCRAMELFMALKSMKATSFAEDGLMKFAKRQILVLDEVHINAATFARQGEEFVQDMLTTLVDIRYSNGLCTILVGNLDPAGLEKVVGSNIVSRLQESGGIIEYSDVNYRQQKK
jgi:hypothetical protein